MLSGLSRQKMATSSQNGRCGIGLRFTRSTWRYEDALSPSRQSEARQERCSQLIQGVHAETISFSSYADACEIALTPGWPWLGEAGLQGSREVNLGGVPPRRVRLRVSEAEAHGHSTVCSIELLEVDRLFTPRIQIELTLQPNSSGTRLTVSGLFARDLVRDPNSDPEVSRHLANDYLRSLIEKVAEEIEGLKGRSEATKRPIGGTRRK
jgi:hypothetical protein